jgi:5-methyltetrahydropteroyltriglutamate--homocysteine methyltransferase
VLVQSPDRNLDFAAKLQASSAKRPFRADHVGSLLRPAQLAEARAKASAGEITQRELRRVEDAAIHEVVAYQQKLGFGLATDGEFRRAYFHLDFLTAIEGVESYLDPHTAHFHKADGEVLEFSPPRLRVTSKVRRAAPIMLRDYAVIAGALNRGAVGKITLPSPSMALRCGRDQIDREAYPDLGQWHADLVQVYQDEIDDLGAAGCGYLQLDDTNLAYMCDPNQREALRVRGEDPDVYADTCVRLINQSLDAAPEEMFTGIHLCRGNFKSAFVAQGGYEPIAERLFNEIAVDAFLLEYDDDRSGSFEPLRFLPPGKFVVLGLISSKHGQLETRDEILRRVDEAAAYTPLEQLCLSPQCGFASTCEGNDITEDDQRRKLELVVSCAEEIWGAA